MIIAFTRSGDAGQNTQAMGGVMAGISEALVATGVGLFVALPAVVAYNVIQKRIAEVESGALSADQAAHGLRASGRPCATARPARRSRASPIAIRAA